MSGFGSAGSARMTPACCLCRWLDMAEGPDRGSFAANPVRDPQPSRQARTLDNGTFDSAGRPREGASIMV